MEIHSGHPGLQEVPTLLRGETGPIAGWLNPVSGRRLWLHSSIIVLGSGLFGAAMGAWRAPEQALFTAIKFPLVILLTTLGNGLLNGMLAPLLGVNLGFRQSLLTVMLGCTITAALLGAFSPIVLFMVWNTAPMAAHSPQAATGHNFLLLMETAAIAFAGCAGNTRLFAVLRELSGSKAAARRVLLAWFAGNLLLGSQLSWILRPFVGSPNLPVEFLRTNALVGNFFESLASVLRHFLT